MIAVIVAVVLAAGTPLAPRSADASARGAEPPSRTQLVRDRQRLDRLAARVLGADYGCTQLLPDIARPRAIRIAVTTDEAAARARELRARIASARVTSVKRVSTRLSAAAMETVRRDVEHSAPTEGTSWTIGRTALRGFDCPPVVVTVKPPSATNEATEAWLSAAIGRHGADRVVLRRSTTGPRAE